MDTIVTLCDWENSLNYTFEEVSLTEGVRQTLPSYRMHSEGSLCDYDDSYGDIHLILQDMGYNSYWAYIRDYSFGHMRMLGEGFYEYDPDLFDEDTASCVCAGEDLHRRMDVGEIDLDKELYDYYHALPTGAKVPWFYSGETMSVAEAAERIGCSASRVKKMVEDRKLEGYKSAGEINVTTESVEGRIAFTAVNGIPTKSTSFKMMNACSVMSPEKTDACYRWARRVDAGEIDAGSAASKVALETGMRESSAKMYVNAVLAMLGGAFFGHDINKYSVNRYLDCIWEDYGLDTLQAAWDSLMLRFEYTKKKGNTCWYYKKAVERSKREHA